MQKNALKRGTAWLAAMAMTLSVLPVVSYAADDTYTKINTADEFTTGKYIIVTDNGYAMTTYDSTASNPWVLSEELTAAENVTVDGDSLTVSNSTYVWDITVSETVENSGTGADSPENTKTAQLKDSNNVIIAPSTSGGNGISIGEYNWTFVDNEDGTFSFCGTSGSYAVTLASNGSSSNKFRAYKDSTVSGSSNYHSKLTLYKQSTSDGNDNDGEEAAVVAIPAANPASGTTVSIGDTVTLDAAPGADIYYTASTSAGEPDDPAMESVSYSNAITLDETMVYDTDKITIKAIAVSEGIASNVLTLNYTVESNDSGTGDSNTDDSDTEKYAQKVTALEAGDQVVLYLGSQNKAITATASGSKLSSTDGTIDADNGLEVNSDMAVFTVYKDSDGYLSFITENGNYLTSPATGNGLSLAGASSDYSLWTLEDAVDGFYIKNVNAIYSGNAQYIEYYSGNFTTYGFYPASASAYTFQIYKTGHAELPDYAVDKSVSMTIAQWAGNADYTGITNNTIYGDLLNSNDMLDSGIEYTAVVSGEAIAPYTTSTSSTTGGTNYYMGGKALGSGTDDYIQLKLSSAGYADMELAFRLRASNTGPGSFNVQYSTDGTEFTSFTSGTYSYAYTKYTGGTPTDVKESGNISDGIAKTSLAPANYVTFTFDVPTGAENAEALYIRLVPGAERANAATAPSASGVVRMDSVVLTGSPVISDSRTGYVTVTPDGSENQAVGTELEMTSKTADAKIYYRFGIEGNYELYDSNNKPTLPALPTALQVYATSEGKEQSITGLYQYKAGAVSAVEITPNGGGVYIEEGSTSAVTLKCAAAGSTIYYTIDDGEYVEYTEPITLKKGFGSMTIKAYAVKEGFADSPVTTRAFTERESDTYNLYFGQLHSHTNYSDGAGSCDDAFKYASNLDESKNIDFLAITDHSNSFDNESSASITDGSMSEEWKEGHELADKYTTNDFVGIYGYEMTWSNGLGHINTFNTDGFQSRTQSDYTTYSTALENYYTALQKASDSLNQFNHPGTSFGDFQDFANYTPEIDNLINIIEVGNGEGAIGSSGYFPSYEYYTRALDKGWHLAPTNSQDNHKGNWGDSNTGRTVVLADTLTRDNIYDAIRNYRVYATEDENLEISYKLNDNEMGSILSLGSTDAIHIEGSLSDVNDSGSATVQVIVNNGKILDETAVAGSNGNISFDFDNNNYSYYYLRVTQADGQIAVTAPVWTGEVEAVGITGFTSDTELSVVGNEQTFTLGLYNNEDSALTVNSIEFTDRNGTVLHTDNSITEVEALGTASCSFSHTFTQDGIITVTATVKAALNGVEKTYTQDLELNVMPSKLVSKIIVDGTHYNDYVTGYYGANMNNMTAIAADSGVKVEIVTDEITKDILADCSLLVISAPAKKSGTANAGNYEPSTFSDEFIALIKDYVNNGGNVIVCGLADYQDSRTDENYQSAAQINKLLNVIGSTMSINDDEVYDETNNGGQAYRMYPEKFNMDSEWLKGVIGSDSVEEGAAYQTYSQYSGCSVNPGNGTWLVKGFDTTYSIDSDKDGSGGITLGEKDVVFLAAEKMPAGGTVFAAGGVFLSDFEVKAELDNIWDLPYANRTIFENIMATTRTPALITDISEVRKAELNRIFAIEGYVTSGTSDKNTTFFDAIYVQDKTGGITVFPYSQTGLKIGTKVRITGYTDEYQGDKEIQILSVEILDDAPYSYEPKLLTTAQATDYDTYGGQLVKVSGTASDIIKENGIVSQFKVTDSSGVAATVFIDGYITNANGVNDIGNWLIDGTEVEAAGLLYKHPEGGSDVSVPVLRVRNCDEIISDDSPSDSAYTLTYDNGAVTVTGSEAITGEYVLIEAIYNDGGSLNKLITYPVTTVNTPIQVSTDSDDRNVKFMLWNSLKGMTPMAETIEIK